MSAKATRYSADTPTEYDGEGIWLGCPDCGGAHEKLDDPDFAALLDRLCSEIGASSRSLYSRFGMDACDGRWDVLPREGLFKVTDVQGRTALARYGIVASWNAKSHGWLWAWGFPEAWRTPPPCLAPVHRLKDRAEAMGWRAVTTRHLKVNEHEAWHLTNLTAETNGFPMVYRARVNDVNHHYYAIDLLRWTS